MKLSKFLPYIFIATSAMTFSAYAETSSTQGTDSFTPAQRTAIEQIVHSYLIKNPQVLVEVANALQQQQTEQQSVQAQQQLPANAKKLFYSSTSPVAGNPNGAVTLVEFFDYQCPHCKNVAVTVNKLINDNPDLRVVFKQLPIFGANSEFAARAALAAAQQGKYMAFHNALMNDQNQLTSDEVLNIAKQVGLDTQKLQQAMNSDAVSQELTQNSNLANAFNFPGTPAFIIAKVPAGGLKNGSAPTKAYFIPGEANEQYLSHDVAEARKG